MIVDCPRCEGQGEVGTGKQDWWGNEDTILCPVCFGDGLVEDWVTVEPHYA